MIKRLVLVACLLFPAAGWCAGAILVLGDSIGAGYGLPRNVTWVSLLEQRLSEHAPDYRVINASVSGETAAGGARRVASELAKHRPRIVIVELGGNDGLRGAPLKALKADLDTIVTTALKHGARVLLLGMRIPPNYGASYTRAFEEVFTAVAHQHRVAFVPFLLDGFGARQDMFQPDGIHPNAAAQPIMVETVWKALALMLK
jgi:acyl-CoA thioesterase I